MKAQRYQGVRGLFPFLVVLMMVISPSVLMAELEPSEGALLGATQVRLSWAGEIEGVEHDVQLALSDGSADPFVNPIIEERTTAGHLVITDGLEFGSVYLWRVRSIDDGVPGAWDLSSTFSIRTLPFDFALEVDITTGSQPAQPGLTLFNHCASIVGFDLDGELVLMLDTPARVADCRSLGNGQFLFVGGGRAWIVDLEGSVIWASPDSNTFRVHHCASMMPSGNVLMVVREYQDVDQDGVVRTWQGDRIVEMNPATDEIVWEWNTFDYFTTQDYDVHQTNYWNDWTHINDAHYVEADNSVYISTRHLSRITRIDYDTGDVVYNMGMDFDSGLVDFGDDLFSYQHSPQLLPNGNMVLFDNGNRRGGVPANGQNGQSYAIELAFTGSPPTDAEIVWSWQTPVYCSSTGDADRLENGNTLVTATHLNGVHEVAPDGEEVWRLSLLSIETCPGLRPGYRATRIPGIYLEDPEAPCLGDLDGDGQVAVDDVLALLSQWGGSGSADLDGSGEVEVNDVLLMLQKWGPCSS